MKLRIYCALGIALLGSSCDRKPEGQTVAVVNNEEITAAELNAELGSANLPATLSKTEARSKVLEALIDRRLLAQQARADGVDKSPDFLNQERKSTENLLVNTLLSRQLKTAAVPTAAEISQFQTSRPGMFAKRETWTLEQLQYPTPKDPATQASLAAAKSLAEFAATLTAKNIKFAKGSTRVDTATLPQEMYAQITSLAAGTPFIVPGGDRSVANVIAARQSAPLTENEARTVALNGLRQARVMKLVQDRVKAARASAEIEYQAGYKSPKK
jgi:EpsD family peptidyl-prolyl cis-trans isomerase